MILNDGRVAEWLKAPVLKTGRGFTLPRGFESHPFRHLRSKAGYAGRSRIYAGRGGQHLKQIVFEPIMRTSRSAHIQHVRLRLCPPYT